MEHSLTDNISVLTGVTWTADKIIETIEQEFKRLSLQTPSSKEIKKEFKLLVDEKIIQQVFQLLQDKKYNVEKNSSIIRIVQNNNASKSEIKSDKNPIDNDFLTNLNLKKEAALKQRDSDMIKHIGKLLETAACSGESYIWIGSDEYTKNALEHYKKLGFKIEYTSTLGCHVYIRF